MLEPVPFVVLFFVTIIFGFLLGWMDGKIERLKECVRRLEKMR